MQMRAERGRVGETSTDSLSLSLTTLSFSLFLGLEIGDAAWTIYQLAIQISKKAEREYVGKLV